MRDFEFWNPGRPSWWPAWLLDGGSIDLRALGESVGYPEGVSYAKFLAAVAYIVEVEPETSWRVPADQAGIAHMEAVARRAMQSAQEGFHLTVGRGAFQAYATEMEISAKALRGEVNVLQVQLQAERQQRACELKKSEARRDRLRKVLSECLGLTDPANECPIDLALLVRDKVKATEVELQKLGDRMKSLCEQYYQRGREDERSERAEEVLDLQGRIARLEVDLADVEELRKQSAAIVNGPGGSNYQRGQADERASLGERVAAVEIGLKAMQEYLDEGDRSIEERFSDLETSQRKTVHKLSRLGNEIGRLEALESGRSADLERIHVLERVGVQLGHRVEELENKKCKQSK